MLDKICTDLETSKKLKGLGVDLETPFIHTLEIDTYSFLAGELEDKGSYDYCLGVDIKVNFLYSDDEYKAYTLEQILEVLPDDYNYGAKFPDLAELKITIKAIYYHNHINRLQESRRKENESLATTAARLLIKLIEDKIITIDEVNK